MCWSGPGSTLKRCVVSWMLDYSRSAWEKYSSTTRSTVFSAPHLRVSHVLCGLTPDGTGGGTLRCLCGRTVYVRDETKVVYQEIPTRHMTPEYLSWLRERSVAVGMPSEPKHFNADLPLEHKRCVGCQRVLQECHDRGEW